MFMSDEPIKDLRLVLLPPLDVGSGLLHGLIHGECRRAKACGFMLLHKLLQLVEEPAGETNGWGSGREGHGWDLTDGTNLLELSRCGEPRRYPTDQRGEGKRPDTISAQTQVRE